MSKRLLRHRPTLVLLLESLIYQAPLFSYHFYTTRWQHLLKHVTLLHIHHSEMLDICVLNPVMTVA